MKPLPAETALVGKPAPKLTAKLVGGDNFSLADQQGIVMLDSWSATCGLCRKEMPVVAEERKARREQAAETSGSEP